jgi:hypothetical protein
LSSDEDDLDSNRTDRKTALGLAAVALIWGANFAIVKLALQELTPLTLNALRFPLASLVLLIVVLSMKGPRLPDRRDVARVIAMGVMATSSISASSSSGSTKRGRGTRACCSRPSPYGPCCSPSSWGTSSRRPSCGWASRRRSSACC